MSATNRDREQRQAIETRQPCIVRASAGSGKTTVLTEHYLHLLESEECSVAGIIALTFTRKAAGEMYQRIFRLLIERSKERPQLAAQIDRFADATITTLDSYCLRIVRSASSLFPFGNEPRIDPIAYGELLHHTAFRTLQTHAKRGMFLWATATHAASLDSLLQQMLCYFDATHLPCTYLLDIERMRSVQQEYLEQQVIAIYEQFSAARQRCLSLSNEHKLQRRIADLPAPATPSLSALASDESATAIWNEYAKLTLRSVGRSKDDAQLLKQEAQQIRDYAKQLLLILDYHRSSTEHEAIYRLVIDFQRQLNAQKMRHGLFNYGNILELAIAALSRSPALHAHIQQTVTAVLVDEFQDNNLLQKNLLYLLAGARPTRPQDPFHEIPFPATLSTHLFLVGDDKQSIYRFRGADVQLFNTMYQQFREHGGIQVELSMNYRTHSGLLEPTNKIFGAVFADRPVSARAYWQPDSEYAERAAPFLSLDYYRDPDRDSAAPAPAPAPADSAAAPAAAPTPTPTAAEFEAHGIADTIRRFMTDPHARLFDTGKYRPPNYDDFAILLRTRTHSAVIERALRAHNIPYQSATTTTLFDDAPAYDIYSLLFLAFYPQSSYYFAAVLRAPWVSCSDEALHRIISDTEERRAKRAEEGEGRGVEGMGGAFSAAPPLSADDQQKYHHAALLFAELQRRMIDRSVPEVLDFLWYEWGYCYHLAGDGQSQRQRPELYEALRQLACDSDDLYQFFSALGRRLEERRVWYTRVVEEERDYLRSDHRVQLLTIHKAKGLEFPVVFLAQCDNPSRSDHKTAFVYDPDLGYSVTHDKENVLFDLRASERQRQEAAELQRLLYVALTRAKSHLFISAHRPQRVGSKTDRHTLWGLVAGSAADLVRPHDTADLPTSFRRAALSSPSARSDPPRLPISSPPAIPFAPTVVHLNATALSDAAYSAAAPAATAPAAADAAPSSPAATAPHPLPALAIDTLADVDHAEFGTLCHRLMVEVVAGRIREHPVSTEFLRQLAATHYPYAIHDDRDAAESAILDSLSMIANLFFTSELYRQFSVAGVTTFCERSFMLLQKIEERNYVLHGVIDALIIDQTNKRLVIVDYKSDRTLDVWRYLGQIGCYLAAAERFYRGEYELSAMIYALRSGECHKIDPAVALRIVSEGRHYAAATNR